MASLNLISSVEEVSTSAGTVKHQDESGVFSNSLESGGQARRITIIALDLINTPLLDQTYARRSIMKMLATRRTMAP